MCKIVGLLQFLHQKYFSDLIIFIEHSMHFNLHVCQVRDNTWLKVSQKSILETKKELESKIWTDQALKLAPTGYSAS